MLLLEWKLWIWEIKFKIYQVSKSILAVKSQTLLTFQRHKNPHGQDAWNLNFFFHLKREGHIDITRTKINLGSHCCEKDCHFKKILPFVLKYIGIEETSLHAYFNFFYYKQASRRCEKIFFLNIEYLESLQGLVLKKICRTVFS